MATPDEFFSATLDSYLAGQMKAWQWFDLWLSPKSTLKRLPQTRMMMPRSTIDKAISKHGIDVESLRKLPTILRTPTEVYESVTQANSFIFRLSLDHGGESLVAALEYCHHKDHGLMYMVKSIHPRPDHHFENWEKDGKLLYRRAQPKPAAEASPQAPEAPPPTPP